MTVFVNTAGNQTFRGTLNDYDQVDYQGSLRDYTLTLNLDGSITVYHPRFGTDTLYGIDGLWFDGDQAWYSMSEALAIAGDVDGTVDADGVIVGNLQDNVLTGTSGDDVFYGDRGDDLIDGNGGGYNQVDYDGARADYTIVRNTDGSLTVSHAVYGTDTLIDIDGFWFHGEQQWYSVNDAVAEAPAPEPEPEPTVGELDEWGVLNGTTGNDTLRYGEGVTSLYGGRGDDRLIGEEDAYSQANYDGKASDYSFTRNADGSVTVEHTSYGTDTLIDIDGIWFSGAQAWYTIEDLLDDDTSPNPEPEPAPEPQPEPDTEVGTGVLVDGVITGSNAVDDLLIGTNGADRLAPGMGNDRIEGGGGQDVLIVDGDVIEWTFFTNAAGETVMTHPTWGENTLSGVERIFFGRSAEVIDLQDAIAQTDGLPAFRVDADDVLNGTNGDDVMVGDADGTNFYGGVGNDSFIGAEDSFDQINYDGARSEYAITQNRDGSITIDHPIWGTDTLTDIDALVFTGREPGADGAEVAPFQFVRLEDLFNDFEIVISEPPSDPPLFG